ncbi:hypothetical protein FHS21_001321 [Phyllobacterium trifolii]|uniref:Uncharacterized protein n=1 Tax=Phyllobacterium trifolii TaxID=300193 RepID=A0A839U7E3_9HYPH|nr:hypothetical protein [Phyllobacterium trifolii]MBB3144920.1 hypothetical protein [Phyllobacterium trifolii]
MRWTNGEPGPAMTDPILVTHKEHGLMLATWQEHRGSYIGVKATGDTHAPFFHALIDVGTTTKWFTPS